MQCKASWHKHKRQHLRRFLLLALLVSKSLTQPHITVSRLLIHHARFFQAYHYYSLLFLSKSKIPTLGYFFFLICFFWDNDLDRYCSTMSPLPTFRSRFVGDTVTLQKTCRRLTDISDSVVEIELLHIIAILQLQKVDNYSHQRATNDDLFKSGLHHEARRLLSFASN